MRPYSVDTPTACCCCNFFSLTARTCDRIAIISLTFQPTAVIQRVCLRVLLPCVQAQHVRFNQQQSNALFCGSLWSNALCTRLYNQVSFWHERFFVFHLMNCDNVTRYVIRTYSKYRFYPPPDRRGYGQTRSFSRLRASSYHISASIGGRVR